MIKRQTTSHMALNSSNRRTEPLSSAEKARYLHHRRVLPQYWCTACAKLSSMLTLEEASKILAPTSRVKAQMKQTVIQIIPKGHEITISTGEKLLCINSLSMRIF